MMRAAVLLLWVLMLATGCGGRVAPPPASTEPPGVYPSYVITPDGYRLPLHHWAPEGEPRGVVLALHGFGDHGASFEALSAPLTEAGFKIYAPDQRGFGATSRPGIWAGQAAMTADVRTLTGWLRERHPGLPVFLVGKSMGGAVVLATLGADEPPQVDGAVLIAPAVWARDTMPWYQRLGLWVMLRIAPGMNLSGDTVHDLGIRPTDDIEVARALSRDPLVLKKARVDTVHGLTELMGQALEASAHLPGPALILYGGNDQVIPARPVCAMLERLPEQDSVPWRMAFYPEGYHMLTRYTGAAQTHADLAAWLTDVSGSLPSGREASRSEVFEVLCAGRARSDDEPQG